MIRIVAVGRLRTPWLQQGCEDYLRRIGKFARAEVVEVDDSTPATEAKELLARAKPGAGNRVLIACDRQGEAWTSQQLSQLLGRHGSPTFLMGGPEGLHTEVLDAADHCFGMGRITLPHELARLVLLEQIYRGLTMLRGHPYHR